jgi:hypothetical protein
MGLTTSVEIARYSEAALANAECTCKKLMLLLQWRIFFKKELKNLWFVGKHPRTKRYNHVPRQVHPVKCLLSRMGAELQNSTAKNKKFFDNMALVVNYGNAGQFYMR